MSDADGSFGCHPCVSRVARGETLFCDIVDYGGMIWVGKHGNLVGLAELDRMSIVMQYITPTRYCWPITDINELRESSRSLRSRHKPGDRHLEHGQVGVENAVNYQLGITKNEECATLSPFDETGKSVLFLHVLAPLARERSRSLSLLDDAANGKPLLVTVLIPDMAFNVSEIEAAYEFSVHESLADNFGEKIDELIIIHNGSLYITAVALFCILCQQHPALLMSLAYALYRNEGQGSKVCEVFKNLDDELTRTMDLPSASIMHRVRVDVISDSIESMNSMIWNQEEHVSYVIRQQLDDALTSLLGDEIAALERQYQRIIDSEETPPLDAMEIDDTPGDLLRMSNGTKRVRQRLLLLRQTIPHG